MVNSAGGESAHLAERSPQEAELASHVLVGESASFQQVLRIADTAALHDCVVLLEGESGTGKELVARRIHMRSDRENGPFIPVNCPGIGESLFESQFYGHMKGAFTGASSDTMGAVRAAEGGTLLLDEVGELAFHLQSKLLRLLQEREVTPVGAARPIPVDVRFIASTNRSLVKAMAEGTFRKDLYHRLNIVRIQIQPLRNRPEDIEPLLNYYLDYHARQYNMPVRRLSTPLRRTLRQYTWPGNVRELCGYVERLYAADVPPMPPAYDVWEDGYASCAESQPLKTAPDRMPLTDSVPLGLTLAEAEACAIRRALELSNYNRSAASRMLQIHRSTLLRKMRSLGLE